MIQQHVPLLGHNMLIDTSNSHELLLFLNAFMDRFTATLDFFHYSSHVFVLIDILLCLSSLLVC